MKANTPVSIYRTLIDALGSIVTPTRHHVDYVREACTTAREVREELEGALALATEKNDAAAKLVFAALLGFGRPPVGVWGVILAEHCFGYVNNHYCALARAERGTASAWD